MQVQTSGTETDFLGWGTYKGAGSTPGSGGECVDKYDPGWKVYFDGTKFGTYFCHSDWGSVGETVADQFFTLKSGACDGVTKWRAILNGVTLTCSRASGYKAFALTVGLEVINYSVPVAGDVRFHDAERFDDATSSWTSWTGGSTADTCYTIGYQCCRSKRRHYGRKDMRNLVVGVVLVGSLVACRFAGGQATYSPPPTITEAGGSVASVGPTLTARPSASALPSLSPGPTAQPRCGETVINEVIGPAEAFPAPGRPPMRPIASGRELVDREWVESQGFRLSKLSTDIPMQIILATYDGERLSEVAQFYGLKPISTDETLDDVIDEGGIVLIQKPTAGVDAEVVRQEVGARAYLVKVGPFDAALVWADPYFDGSKRAFNIYWSDGTYDFALISGLDTADESVGFANTAYC